MAKTLGQEMRRLWESVVAIGETPEVGKAKKQAGKVVERLVQEVFPKQK